MKKIILNTEKLDTIDSLAIRWVGVANNQTFKNYVERVLHYAFVNMIREFRRRVASLGFIVNESNLESAKAVFSNVKELASALRLPLDMEIDMVENILQSFEQKILEAVE